VSVVHVANHGSDRAGATEVAYGQLLEPDGMPIDAQQDRQCGGAATNDTTQCVLGVLAESLRSGLVPDSNGGCSVVVGTSLGGLTDAGRDAAVAAATLVAITKMMGVTVEPSKAVALCQRVENEWLGASVGAAGASCALLGEPNMLTQLRCDPCTPGGAMRLPEDLMLVGVDSGVVHPKARVKYDRARTAAVMGRALINRIIRHDAGDDVRWDGYLARVSVTDYVDCFRDRIPTKLKGSEFLERFGETGDSLTQVDPDYVYKIRSRTEHHIYEHARSCQFVECLSRSIRKGDHAILLEAGELMYASHWSYGQRCGLGSVETDLLVNLIRQHGEKAEVYGAKISGRGCGGVVTVLMRSTESARTALEAAMEAYHERTGKQATLLEGSLPGGLVAGARQL
jgi:L-arabinokinase